MRPEQGTLISRAQAMAALLELLTDQPVIICNGFPSREAQKLVDRPTHFYMIGSMGSAPAIALGVALAKPHKQVITFDGDGNVLMGMGTLATVAARAPMAATWRTGRLRGVASVVDELIVEAVSMVPPPDWTRA